METDMFGQYYDIEMQEEYPHNPYTAIDIDNTRYPLAFPPQETLLRALGLDNIYYDFRYALTALIHF
jgi:hypothetical protein